MKGIIHLIVQQEAVEKSKMFFCPGQKYFDNKILKKFYIYFNKNISLLFIVYMIFIISNQHYANPIYTEPFTIMVYEHISTISLPYNIPTHSDLTKLVHQNLCFF